MTTIRAIYENGVCRPLEPVDLPENCAVEFEPRPSVGANPCPVDTRFAHLDPKLARVYATLSRRHAGGSADLAARHDEHQPYWRVS